jgi:DUF2958 family protein
MELLTEEIRHQLPPLGATAEVADPIAVVKFFTPGSRWTWFAYEFDGMDIFMGAVSGEVFEFGTFSLSELEQLRGPCGMAVERDLAFAPTPLSKIVEQYDRRVSTHV